MNLKPTKRNILVKLYPVSVKGQIVLPETSRHAPADSDRRQKCKVLAISLELENDPNIGISPGDFLLLRPEYNYLPVDGANNHALIHHDAVEAIVLDDEAP